MQRPITVERAKEIIVKAQEHKKNTGLYHINYKAVMLPSEQNDVVEYWWSDACSGGMCFNDVIIRLSKTDEEIQAAKDEYAARKNC